MFKLIIITGAVFFSGALYAQNDVIRQKSCADTLILRQADSLRKQLTEGGFSVMREAMMTMESEYEMPVIVPLEAGQWYQIIFIGDIRSRLYEVRMYDYNEKEVVYKKHMWGDVDGNIINYSYIPRTSEFHMIKPLQVNKKQKKNLCGCIMLLRKTLKSELPQSR